MEERYITDHFKDFWSLSRKYSTWLRVEKAVYEAHIQSGTFTDSNSDYIKEKLIDDLHAMPQESLDEILAIEHETKHDVVAFLKWLEIKTEGRTRFFHYGMTSSDLVDTSMAINLVKAMALINSRMTELCYQLQQRAHYSTDQVMMGRSHGMYAQPTTVSNFFAGHLSEFLRAQECMISASEAIRYGKISGPVGSYLNIHPSVESLALERLDLKVEPASTQIIPRDRHLQVIFSIARCAVAVERFATNIRLLHRSEVDEISEHFAQHQTGSSAMPHKKNPISCENLCGMSRYIRALVAPAFEDVVLWHERDISHSSVERLIIPEATAYLDYMLKGTIRLVTDLVISPQRMKERVESNPQWMSERLMLNLVDAGSLRHSSHAFVEGSVHSAQPQTEWGMNSLNVGGDIVKLRSYSHIFEHAKMILKRVRDYGRNMSIL